MYLMAATMVAADGRIEANEIAIAEGIGQQLLEGFDPVDFRAVCRSSDLPRYAELVDILKGALDAQAKEAVLNYLTEIARADGEISSDERELLDHLKAEFQPGSVPG